MHHRDNQRLWVTVIIPTYNCARFIREAVDSALNQTRAPDEIIVVDDGSTDETDRVLGQYGPPVRVIRQDNRGRSAARNQGLRAARGDLVVFLDSDDTLMPASIERRAVIFETSSDVGVVYGDMVVVNAAGETLGDTREYAPGPRPSGYILAELALRCFILMPAMIRRSALGDCTFDEKLDQAEDYDLWRRLAATCRFQYIDQPVAYYRLHETNTIVTQTKKTREAELEVQRRFFEMAQFHRLTRRQRARAYCSHGAKNAALGRTASARRSLARAVWTCPDSLTSFSLLLLSLLNPSMLSRVILRRRRMTRKTLADVIGSGCSVAPEPTTACGSVAAL